MGLDHTDYKIIAILQRDASLTVDTIAEMVNLSRNACWRRIKTLEDTGVLLKRVALANPDALDLGLTVFISVKTTSHSKYWAEKFRKAVRGLDQICGVYRMAGETDYVIHARVRDMKAYDRLYAKLIDRIEISDVTAGFVMEEIKHTTELPVIAEGFQL